MDNKEQLEEVFKFLISKPGYLKNLKRAQKQFDNIDMSIIREAAVKARRALKMIEGGEDTAPEIDIPEGMAIKSQWQGADGEWKYSFQKATEADATQEDITAAVKETLLAKVKPWRIKKKSSNNKKGLFLYTSDKHVGAHTKENSVYKNDYNAEVFEKRMFTLLEEAHEQYKMHGRFDKICFMDLGDPLDGFGQQTTRGGHSLPQNMTDREQFDTFVNVHRKFFDELVKMDIADSIDFVAATNDNHAGPFGYCATRALALYLEVKYPDMGIHLYTRFMDNYEYGDHTFIVTHGKDEEDMKFGFPIKLNDKVENYINDYINIKKVDSKYIHLIKGDLHQSACEYGKRFRYKNVMSMYGSSKWIHTNYGSGFAGVDFEIVEKNGSRIAQDRLLY